MELMELRSLKYLLSLERSGSFTGAAAEHYVTQPAVSIQLKKLQKELGTVLFEMRGRDVVFTGAGRRVLDYAGRICDLEKQMLGELADIRGLEKGEVSVGTIDAASIYILPPVFSLFRRRYPGIELTVEVSSTAPLVAGLLAGRYDLAVGSLPAAEGDDIEEHEIFREELVPIAPPGHRSLDSPGGPDILSAYPFITFHRESVTRRMIEELLAGLGVQLEVSMAIDSQEAIKKIVSAGLGLSILPRRTVEAEIERGELAEIDIRGLKIERRIGIMLPAGRYLPATARAFLGVLDATLSTGLPGRLTAGPDEGSGGGETG